VRILWVKAGKLLPVDTGGKIRSYNLLRSLAGRHKVTFLSYYLGAPDHAYEGALARELPGAVAVAVPKLTDTLAGQVLDYAWHLPLPEPYSVTKFTAPEVRSLLKAWMKEKRFDVAICDFLAASLNFPQTLTIPTILFQHNVESVLWHRQADFEANWLKRIVFKLEAAKMAHYESSAVRRFHHIVAVSEEDRQRMMSTKLADAARISVVPTGVNLQQYRAAARSEPQRPLVVFIGSMDWEANIDGVEYFCQEIWPAVRAKLSEARFRIVGRDPHRRVRKLASDSVEVTGRVDSVISHLKDATVFVVPLRMGGGTRLKIYEAMAMGKAVVSTSVGAEGLDVHGGEDILLADDAKAFADCVIRLLSDQELRQSLEMAASKLAAQYDWTVIADRFEQVLEGVTRQVVKQTVGSGVGVSDHI
jgi:polysaccharide biosynthesis protein PslH